ncbi:MAG: hypothetical protein K2J13_01355, partial [Clostridia bacterium]|nr:hypothetical protein [Clostridia bacterium]
NVKADAKPKANANAKANATSKPKAQTAAKPKTDTTAKAKSNTTAKPKADATTKTKASATVNPKSKSSASEKSTASAKKVVDTKVKTEAAEKPKPETSAKEKVETKPKAATKANVETSAKPKSDTKTDTKEKSKSNTTEKAKADKKPKEKAKSNNTSTNKNKIIVITVIAVLAILVIILSIVLGVKSCSKPKAGYQYPYKSVTSVGYYAEQIGTVDRVKPVKEIKNGGLSAYPEYGKSLDSVLGDSEQAKAARQALIAEASFMTSSDTWNGGDGGFTWMDKDGWLYSGKVTDENPTHALEKNGQFRRLYQHSASKGLYGGDVADDEQGIIQQVTISPRGYNSYSVTGVYAPAGEVIKIEISEQDMQATGGITIHIGQALYNGKANNIWMEKNVMNRFPIILNTMK